MTFLFKLRLMQVKRYPICHTNRDQSVAEHSFNVAIIAGHLTEDFDRRAEVVEYALHHDMEEVYTGDIPSSFKRHLLEHVPAARPFVTSPEPVDPQIKAIVKLADYIEAIYYLKEFGGSRQADKVLQDILCNFLNALQTSEAPPSAIIRAKELLQCL